MTQTCGGSVCQTFGPVNCFNGADGCTISSYGTECAPIPTPTTVTPPAGCGGGPACTGGQVCCGGTSCMSTAACDSTGCGTGPACGAGLTCCSDGTCKTASDCSVTPVQCGTNPPCTGAQVCCNNTSCMTASQCATNPPGTGTITAPELCTQATEQVDCPGQCCDRYTGQCTSNCGTGCSTASVIYNYSTSHVAVRFLTKDENGNTISWKGNATNDPIRSRTITKDNGDTFSSWSVPGTSFTDGVPVSTKPAASGSVQTFDWTNNKIDPSMNVWAGAANGGVEFKIPDGCSGDHYATVPVNPINSSAWSTHMCGWGYAGALDSDGYSLDRNADGNWCEVYKQNCDTGSSGCKRWCVEDRDGCTDIEPIPVGEGWGIENPGKPPPSTTVYGYHETIDQMLEDLNTSGGGIAKPWPFVPYSGQFTFNAKFWRSFSGLDAEKIKNTLYYTPPAGMDCGEIIGYYSGPTTLSTRPEFLTPEEMVAEGVAEGTCALRMNGLKQTNLLLIEFKKAYQNWCAVSIDGQSEVFYNTNTQLTSVEQPPLNLTSSGVSNEDRPPYESTGGTIRLYLEKWGTSWTPPAFSSYPLGFFSPYSFIKEGTSNYFKWYQTCRSTSLSSACSVPLLANALSLEDYVPKTTTATDTYYAHCDMLNSPDGWACTGNPYCDHEGGSQQCTGIVSCSEPNQYFLEEIALYNNAPYYRRKLINTTENTFGAGSNATAWRRGPFDSTQLPYANEGLIQAIGMYDIPSGNGFTTHFHYWIDSKLYITKFYPDAHGFSDWLTNDNSAATVDMTAYELPSPTAKITSYSITHNPTTNKILEAMWVVDPDEIYAGEATYDPIKGYSRTVPLDGNGDPQWASAENWTQLSAVGLTGPVASPIEIQGNAVYPSAVAGSSHFMQVRWRGVGSTLTATNRKTAAASPWNTTTNPTFPPSNSLVTALELNFTSANVLGTTGQYIQAYDAHVIKSGVQDKAKLTVSCLSSCNLCSTGTTANGCGGFCTPSPLLNIVGSSAVTITTPAASPIVPRADQFVDLAWTDTSSSQDYELLAYPVPTDGTLAMTVDAAYLLKADPTKVHYLSLVTPSATLDLDAIPALIAKSPKIRVAIRAVNACGSSNWTFKDIELVQNTGVNVAYLVTAQTTCDVTAPPADTTLATFTTPVTTTLTNNASLANFMHFADNSTNANKTNDSVNTAFAFTNVWHAPVNWFGTGFYRISTDTNDLNQNNYTLSCPSSGSYQNLNAPINNSDRTVYFYLNQAFDAWWQVKGGLLTGNQIKSSIPVSCTTAASCEPYLLNSNFTSVKTAGIPVGFGSPGTVNGGYGSVTRNTADDPLEAEGAGTPVMTNDYSYFETKLAPYTSLGSANTSTLKLTTSGPVAGSGANAPTITTIDGEDYYIWPISGNVSLDLQKLAGDTNWDIGDKKVIILVNGNITFTSTIQGENLVSVSPNGYLLIVASGSITFAESVGKTTYSPADATPSVEGIFVAGTTLSIASDGDSTVVDNRFIGSGAFAGLTGVSLGRSFDGTLADGTSGRLYNNTMATELFIHDPQLMLNTPKFLKDPKITYAEIK